MAAILIIEDEGLIALSARVTLEKIGHQITVTTTGKNALKIIEDAKPDLILLDIKLQGVLDGIEVASIINEKYDLPLIYMTAHSDSETLKRMEKTRYVDFLCKPFNADQLCQAITKIIK